jgi:DNA-binding winged helix-turn-helix (wHTH) protein/tetratricopeptide (TPR) repeat protein
MDIDYSCVQLDGCTIDLNHGRVRRDGETTRLSTIEVRFLRYLTGHPGRDVSREELLEQVWGYHGDVQTRTIDTTVRRLRKKLEAAPSAPRHIITVHGIGYRFEPLMVAHDVTATHTIAAPINRFFGRQAAQVQLMEHLELGRPLVTITGPGGIGKTRFVRRVCRLLVERWRPCAVDLAAARTADDLRDSVATAIGVPLGRATVMDQQIGTVLTRRATLLILDGLDKVAGPGALLCSWLQPETPSRILITSRVRLGLPQETVLALAPLAQADAVALLLARGAALREGYGASTSAARLAQVVDSFDRNPLAIELAAARARVMEPEDLLDRVGLDGLAVGEHGDRLGTMDATVRWSWSTLDPWAQRALAQCTVFSGDFDGLAAEAVVQASAGAPPVTSLIQGLVEHSMLTQHAGIQHAGIPHLGDERPRYHMSQSVRSFAKGRLQSTDEQRARRGHHAHYLAVGNQQATAADNGDLAGLRWLRIEKENLLSVAQNGTEIDQIQAHLVLAPLFVMQGFPHKPLQRLRVLLTQTPEVSLERQAAARYLLARAQAFRGEQAEVAEVLAGLSGDVDADSPLASQIARSHGVAMLKLGDIGAATELFEHAVTLGARVGCEAAEYGGLLGLAQIARAANRLDEAERLATTVLTRTRARKRALWEPWARVSLGLLAAEKADVGTARTHLSAAAEQWERCGHVPGLCLALARLGQILIELSSDPKDWREAAAVLSRVENLSAFERCSETGALRLEAEALSLELNGQMDPALSLIRAALRQARSGSVGQAMEGRLCVHLGALAHRMGDLDGALIAYEKAAKLNMPLALVTRLAGLCALLHAVEGDATQAQAHLAKMEGGAHSTPAQVSVSLFRVAVGFGLDSCPRTRAAAVEQLERSRAEPLATTTVQIRRGICLLEQLLAG